MILGVVRSRVVVVVIVMVIIVGGSSLSQESISKQINTNFLESKRSIYEFTFAGWYCTVSQSFSLVYLNWQYILVLLYEEQYFSGSLMELHWFVDTDMDEVFCNSNCYWILGDPSLDDYLQ